jgi:hypothetical protein
MAFAQFMSSSTGRVARIVAGVLILAAGLFLIQGALGVIVAVVGLVPLVAGALDVCLFAPLFGAPLKGVEVRAAVNHPGAIRPR